jgi:glycosyltransferase involved in cell wall biosynthesis
MKPGETLHTFVVLAYKESPYLERCIQSVLQQHTPTTVLIATATPNAHIEQLANRYELPVLINNEGGNIGKDWNFGLHCGNTPLVTLAHQDDQYLSDYASSCIKAYHKRSASKPLILFNPTIVKVNGKKPLISYKNIVRWVLLFPFHFNRCIQSTFWRTFAVRFGNSISCPGVCYCMENLKGFRFDESMKFTLDWDAWHRLSLQQGSFVYIPQALHIHLEHSDSTTNTIGTETLIAEEKALLTRIWNSKRAAEFITKLLRVTK